VPRLGCNMPTLAVLAGSMGMARPVVAAPDPAMRAVLATGPAKPPFSFGLELECGDCGWRSGPGRTVRWFSLTLPRVLAVAPGGPGDQAGVKPGDTLLEIDGCPLDSTESCQAIGKLRAGEAVSLKLRRGHEERAVTITPRANEPARRF